MSFVSHTHTPSLLTGKSLVCILARVKHHLQLMILMLANRRTMEHQEANQSLGENHFIQWPMNKTVRVHFVKQVNLNLTEAWSLGGEGLAATGLVAIGGGRPSSGCASSREAPKTTTSSGASRMRKACSMDRVLGSLLDWRGKVGVWVGGCLTVGVRRLITSYNIIIIIIINTCAAPPRCPRPHHVGVAEFRGPTSYIYIYVHYISVSACFSHL